MQIKKIISVVEDFAPLSLQEPYDNAGLILGDPAGDVDSVLLCIDVTEEVLDEAAAKGAGLVISHHPVIFRPLKKLTGAGFAERVVLKAVRDNIALYAAHTNIDRVWGGVNSRIGAKLGLNKQEILEPAGDLLRKLVVFVPAGDAQKVREAMFAAGAGHIGEYDRCSFNLEGVGSFRGSEGTDPYVGKAGEIHFEKETRIEVIYPAGFENRIVKEMIEAHPYEEVAYDIYRLENRWDRAGTGMVGELEPPEDGTGFLGRLKQVFGSECIRHTRIPERKISMVAVCGGSGSSLISRAKGRGVDVYVSADLKYHDFFEACDSFMIVDIGHFESEQFTMEIFHELLIKKLPNFAAHFSEINTNPIQYF